MLYATCPHCKSDQEIEQDDGFGCHEGIEYEQECLSCEKTFVFTVCYSISCDVTCKPDEHDFKDFAFSNNLYMRCKNCAEIIQTPTKDN